MVTLVVGSRHQITNEKWPRMYVHVYSVKYGWTWIKWKNILLWCVSNEHHSSNAVLFIFSMDNTLIHCSSKCWREKKKLNLTEKVFWRSSHLVLNCSHHRIVDMGEKIRKKVAQNTISWNNFITYHNILAISQMITLEWQHFIQIHWIIHCNNWIYSSTLKEKSRTSSSK